LLPSRRFARPLLLPCHLPLFSFSLIPFIARATGTKERWVFSVAHSFLLLLLTSPNIDV
jgi:formate hydrogenlyase subunit 3/multisubunit Na+/H+ antiporter MnhD subunit